jgi:hypothetical protein
MDANKKPDVRIILASLWTARMLSSLQGDTARFSNPEYLKEMIDGTPEIPVTNGLILIMSIIMAIPIVMIFLSLTLNKRANRFVNLITGIFFIIWELVFISFIYLHEPTYEIFWGFMYLVFAILVVGYAWKWTPKEK